MYPHLLIFAFSCAFLLFVVLLGVAIWKDLDSFRKQLRRHRLPRERYPERMSIPQVPDRESEPRTPNLEKVWLKFG